MNEKELKSLFCKALSSGHVKGNDVIPMRDCSLRIIEEAHLRSFDLLIAVIGKTDQNSGTNHENIALRTRLLEQVASAEKCRIDRIRFFPVEIKSDEDVLDERLPNQIVDAILAFGLSILVLDKSHSDKAKKLGKLIPATTICYTGVEDYFEVTSRFGRFVSGGVLGVSKAALARILGDASPRTYSRLATLQRVLEKLTFNQLFFDTTLTDEELQFLNAMIEIPLPGRESNRIANLILKSANAKLTDYL